jgi:hypothetical protein
LSKIGAPDGVQWHLVLPTGLGVGVVVTALFYYLPVLMINHYATVLFFLGQDAI